MSFQGASRDSLANGQKQEKDLKVEGKGEREGKMRMKGRIGALGAGSDCD